VSGNLSRVQRVEKTHVAKSMAKTPTISMTNTGTTGITGWEAKSRIRAGAYMRIMRNVHMRNVHMHMCVFRAYVNIT
jgi:pectate lyase